MQNCILIHWTKGIPYGEGVFSETQKAILLGYIHGVLHQYPKELSMCLEDKTRLYKKTVDAGTNSFWFISENIDSLEYSPGWSTENVDISDDFLPSETYPNIRVLLDDGEVYFLITEKYIQKLGE